MTTFRQRLETIPAAHRDGWIDEVLGLGELPGDQASLPRGCVPYLPCSVNVLLQAVDETRLGPDDVFVDVGAGLGRVMALAHLLTGCATMGLEVQPHLAAAARALAVRLDLPRFTVVEGDATAQVLRAAEGTVFFFYSPFGPDRLGSVVDALEPWAQVRPLRLCFVDTPPPARGWLLLDPVPEGTSLVVCRTAPMVAGRG